MLLRRIRDHAKSHNWFGVGVDLLIVVLGVFLGTQVSNWNTERIAHEEGASYRARIVSDVVNNGEDMAARAAYFTQVRAAGLRVLQRLAGDASISDEQFLIDAYQATQIYPRPMSRATYDEVLAVGALNTIGDVRTRELVSNYYVAVETSEATFRNVPPYREIVRRQIPYDVQARIRTACAETMTTSSGTGLSRLSLPEHCELGLSRAVITSAAARLRALPGLDLDATRLLSDLDQKLIQAQRAQDRAATLAQELEAAR